MKFVGRQKEVETLKELKNKNSASLVVITGRRRIGKSRLAEEFGKNYQYYSLTGSPPYSGITAENQRKAFALQLEKYFHVPLRYDNWFDLLYYLAQETKKQNAVILMDEISWIGSQDKEFLGTLKTVWDLHFKKNSNLILILCGSVSSWIDKNILSSTGFLGRVSLELHLEELPLKDCAKFWNNSQVSSHEILKILSVTGGVPRYLEEINPKKNAEENIRSLCFDKSKILYNEFEKIFHDLFFSRSHLYKKIVLSLINGALDRNTIANKVDHAPNGVFTEYLDDLIKAGFISRHYSWSFNSGKRSKLSLYRISDNYIRFYLKYIEPNKQKIELGYFEKTGLSSLPAWSTIMGLQFESLVLKNRSLIIGTLNIPAEAIVNDGPYFQRKTNRHEGCQIDYLIQTKFNELYVIEVKFRRTEIKSDVISQMKDKISALSHPKNYSIRPILIHVNGVSESVTEENYFAHIIDFSKYLKS